VSNRYLLIVTKFCNDSLTSCGVIGRGNRPAV